MRILVTGGAGFVGSHLCDHLLEQHHTVICVDSFFSGKKENVSHNLSHPRFTLITHDIRKPINKDLGKIDRIYHLACPASPDQYQFDPILTLETCVIGTQNILKLARKTGARVLYTSTSEVYGDPLQHPQKEEYFGNVDTLGARACYDEGKRAAETLCKDYHEQYGIDARVVRIFNTYGPRMMFNDGRVLSNFIHQALLGEDITVHGTGEQTRSFMYVSDLVKGLEKRMEVVSKDWKPVNLGNPDERSIKNLAEKVKEKTQTQSTVTYTPFKDIPSRIGDPKQRCADISRAKQLCNWEPLVSFEEGLHKTVEDFKTRLQNRPHIVVFIPTYDNTKKGPVENAVKEVIQRLGGWEFDILCAKMNKHVESETHDGRTHIYRLGSGSVLDKFLLPLRAAFFARRLHKKHHYQIAWAIMVSYGALAAAGFSFFTKTPTLLSVFEGTVKDKNLQRGKWLSPLYAIIFRSAKRWQVVGKMTQKQQAWLEDERYVQAVQLDGDWDLLAKKTKDLFNQVEILSTRL